MPFLDSMGDRGKNIQRFPVEIGHICFQKLYITIVLHNGVLTASGLILESWHFLLYIWNSLYYVLLIFFQVSLFYFTIFNNGIIIYKCLLHGSFQFNKLDILHFVNLRRLVRYFYTLMYCSMIAIEALCIKSLWLTSHYKFTMYVIIM